MLLHEAQARYGVLEPALLEVTLRHPGGRRYVGDVRAGLVERFEFLVHASPFSLTTKAPAQRPPLPAPASGCGYRGPPIALGHGTAARRP